MLCDLKLVTGHDRRHNTEVHARDVHLIETILPIFAFIDTGDKGVVIVFFLWLCVLSSSRCIYGGYDYERYSYMVYVSSSLCSICSCFFHVPHLEVRIIRQSSESIPLQFPVMNMDVFNLRQLVLPF